MSVYSGFSTRLQESSYNRLTETLIHLLQVRVLCAVRNEPIEDDIWSSKFSSVYAKLSKLEMQKYLPPKFSESCKELAMHYAGSFNYSRISSASSSFYGNQIYELPETPSQPQPKPPKKSSPKVPLNYSKDFSLDLIEEVIYTQEPQKRLKNQRLRNSKRLILERPKKLPPSKPNNRQYVWAPSSTQTGRVNAERTPSGSAYYDKLMQRYLSVSNRYPTPRQERQRRNRTVEIEDSYKFQRDFWLAS